MSERAPIFVLGITQRSGTHYLYDALLLHADVAAAIHARDPSQASWEDHLLSEATGLTSYVERVARRWNLDPEHGEEAAALLLRSLGEGLTRFLHVLAGRNGASAGQQPLTKTPTLDHIDLIDDLCPASPLVVIVREPGAVVASSLGSFGGNPERWIRHWKRMAGELLVFMDAHPGRVALVRYEDLYRDPAAEMSRLLAHLGLAPERYDFERLSRLPVRGSSQLAPMGKRGWTPVERTADFDPLGRAGDLPRPLAARIDWLLEAERTALGYQPLLPRRLRLRAGQRLLDARWSLARRGNRVIQAVRLAAASLRPGGGRSVAPLSARRAAP